MEMNRQSAASKKVAELYGDVMRRAGASPHGSCPVDLTAAFLRLCLAQSCGKCVPCRVGLDRLLKTLQVNVAALPEEDFDSPLGTGSGAGVIFGATGGVMEAALRTAAFVLEKKNPDVAVLYRDALGEPLSHRAHALLHTDQTTWSLVMEADAAD